MEDVIDVDMRGAVIIERTAIAVCPMVAVQIKVLKLRHLLEPNFPKARIDFILCSPFQELSKHFSRLL